MDQSTLDLIRPLNLLPHPDAGLLAPRQVAELGHGAALCRRREQVAETEINSPKAADCRSSHQLAFGVVSVEQLWR